MVGNTFGSTVGLVASLVALALAAQPAAAVASPEPAAGSAQEALTWLLRADAAAQAQATPGEILAVHAPRLRFSGATGLVAFGADERLLPDQPFRIASVTKLFTAAAALRLVEDGALELDDPIARRLPRAYVSLLAKGGYAPDTITVRQLLTHTSGIYDYTFGPGSNFLTEVLTRPDRRWTALEQVRYAVEQGEPMGRPGRIFAYSDTGYVLLGRIIERAGGRPLAGAFRKLLRFERLGMTHTYLETLERKPPGLLPRAHQYIGGADLTDGHPSFDLYGGGGLVSSVDDLARFMRALVDGRVFRRPTTLRTMLTVPRTNRGVDVAAGGYRPAGAAMGIFKLRVGGRSCLWHAGFWGVDLLACRSLDLVVARATNQALPARKPIALLDEIVRLVAGRR